MNMKGMRVVVDGQHKIIVIEERECIQCNKKFNPPRLESLTCSKKCWRKIYYRKYAEYWKSKTKEWRLNNLSRKAKNDSAYKDKVRHGSIKQKLIESNGLTCSQCGVLGNSFQIVAHHITGNNKEHEYQELLCRSCHCRLHHSNEKKPLTKEQIEMAISTTKNLDEACKILGVNRASLYWKRKRLNLIIPKR